MGENIYPHAATLFAAICASIFAITGIFGKKVVNMCSQIFGNMPLKSVRAQMYSKMYVQSRTKVCLRLPIWTTIKT